MKFVDTGLRKVGQIINSVLRLDSDLLADLMTVEGSIIKVKVEGLEFEFDVCVVDDGIELRKSADKGHPNVSISGPPLALIGLLMAKNQLHHTQDSEIYMEGDVQLARKLAQFAGRLDIDWEEWLAEKTGDVIAHQLGTWGRQLWVWRKRVHQSLLLATGEYLQEEAMHLPTRVETEHFMDEVDSLRDAVERLEARILALQK